MTQNLPLIVRDFTDAEDLYDYSMGYVAQHWPDARVRYRYTNRDAAHRFHPGFADRLAAQLEQMAALRFTNESLAYFQAVTPWLPLPYLQWLRQYRFDPSLVELRQADGTLSIEITGRWFEAIYWEVKILATISELVRTDPQSHESDPLSDGWQEVIHEKARRLSEAGVNWADFGTRRRASFEVQDTVVAIMKQYDGFRGTSNPFLAMKHDVLPIGTYAHQLPMAMQALYGAGSADRMAMEHWVSAYHGNLGIALSDTLTTDHFLKGFDSYYANLFKGVRQDSGDPIAFGEKIIAHYKSLGIDPTTKQIIFSDSLDVDRAVEIHRHFEGRIIASMGIGTNLTADPVMTGRKPMNHVFKLVEADFGHGPVPVVKLSDALGKHSGDPEVVAAVMRML